MLKIVGITAFLFLPGTSFDFLKPLSPDFLLKEAGRNKDGKLQE